MLKKLNQVYYQFPAKIEVRRWRYNNWVCKCTVSESGVQHIHKLVRRSYINI